MVKKVCISDAQVTGLDIAEYDLSMRLDLEQRGPSAPLTGLRLDWETPLGLVRTDRAFVDAVHAALGPPDPR